MKGFGWIGVDRNGRLLKVPALFLPTPPRVSPCAGIKKRAENHNKPATRVTPGVGGLFFFCRRQNRRRPGVGIVYAAIGCGPGLPTMQVRERPPSLLWVVEIRSATYKVVWTKGRTRVDYVCIV